jgi:hypothetical protein
MVRRHTERRGKTRAVRVRAPEPSWSPSWKSPGASSVRPDRHRDARAMASVPQPGLLPAVYRAWPGISTKHIGASIRTGAVHSAGGGELS